MKASAHLCGGTALELEHARSRTLPRACTYTRSFRPTPHLAAQGASGTHHQDGILGHWGAAAGLGRIRRRCLAAGSHRLPAACGIVASDSSRFHALIAGCVRRSRATARKAAAVVWVLPPPAPPQPCPPHRRAPPPSRLRIVHMQRVAGPTNARKTHCARRPGRPAASATVPPPCCCWTLPGTGGCCWPAPLWRARPLLPHCRPWCLLEPLCASLAAPVGDLSYTRWQCAGRGRCGDFCTHSIGPLMQSRLGG